MQPCSANNPGTACHTNRDGSDLNRWIATCLTLCLLPVAAMAADKWESQQGLILDDLPKSWAMTRIADEIEVNGLPMLIYQIKGPQPLRESAALLAGTWARDKWVVTSKAAGREVQVVGVKDGWMKQANLSSNDKKQTQGYISLSDLPARTEADIDTKAPVFAAHLRKPAGTVILNEVRSVDMAGESIMTTMVNNYDVEQNVAFYEQDRAAQAWKMAFRRVSEEDKGTVLKFVSGTQKEAVYTITSAQQQTFIVVNWITR